MKKLMVGAGKAEIRLEGLLSHGRENFVKVLDPLHVRVVLLEADKRAALVSLELTSLMDSESLRTLVARKTGIDPAYIWITVSHTFSAPHIQSSAGGPGGPGGPRGPMMEQSPEARKESQAQTENLLAAVEEAIAQAQGSLREARVGYGRGQSRVNAGRDVESAEGWWLGEGSPAFADRVLPLLRIDGVSGRPIAVVYNYAVQSSVLHEAVMPEGGYYVSGDLVGVASTAVEAAYPGAVALFLCGAAGDQAPRKKASTSVLDEAGRLQPLDRGIEGVEILRELGGELSRDLLAVVEDTTAAETAIKIAVERRTFPVPAKQMPDRSEMGPRTHLEYRDAGFRDTGVEVLQIGRAALVGVKPELSAVTGAQIRETSPFGCTLVATMVNGGAKYMADRLAFDRFTYAAQNGPFGAGAAEVLRDHALAMLREMADEA